MQCCVCVTEQLCGLRKLVHDNIEDLTTTFMKVYPEDKGEMQWGNPKVREGLLKLLQWSANSDRLKALSPLSSVRWAQSWDESGNEQSWKSHKKTWRGRW